MRGILKPLLSRAADKPTVEDIRIDVLIIPVVAPAVEVAANPDAVAELNHPSVWYDTPVSRYGANWPMASSREPVASGRAWARKSWWGRGCRLPISWADTRLSSLDLMENCSTKRVVLALEFIELVPIGAYRLD